MTLRNARDIIERTADLVVPWRGDEKREATDEWEIEQIIGERGRTGTNSHEYRVRWKGFSSTQDRWVKAADIQAEEFIEEFKGKKSGRQSAPEQKSDKGKEEMEPVPRIDASVKTKEKKPGYIDLMVRRY